MLDQIKKSEGHLNPCHKILFSFMWETWTHTKCAKYYVKNSSLPQIPFSLQGCFWNKAVLDKICGSLGRSNSFTHALENPLVHSTVPVYHSIQTPSQSLFSFFSKRDSLCWLQVIRYLVLSAERGAFPPFPLCASTLVSPASDTFQNNIQTRPMLHLLHLAANSRDRNELWDVMKGIP